MQPKTTVLKYEFTLADGKTKTFEVHLRQPGCQMEPVTPRQPPPWTRLDHHRCPNCPLDPLRHAHCPVALNLGDLIQTFRDCLSTERGHIRIQGPTREYTKATTVQSGISSLMGLIMATSGCPILDQLRPLVATHLPFANIEESVYRITSMYLLGQYLRHRRGLSADWELEGLVRLCDAIGAVNKAFSRRLLSISPQDASLNALANLDCFQISVMLSVDRQQLDTLEALFAGYLTEANPIGKGEPPKARTDH